MKPAEDGAPAKKNRPSDSKFKQQKLPAWQPILTAGTVLPAFFIIGIVFIPIGVGLLITSNKVKELSYDYTDYEDVITKQLCKDLLTNSSKFLQGMTKCTVNVLVELKEDWEQDVLIYYGLNNFYQNHRRYVKSRDDKQLLGSPTNANDDCQPFRFDGKAKEKDEKEIPLLPCGAIANSLFNDSIVSLKYRGKDVKLMRTNIAWKTDKGKKFKNPSSAASCGKWSPATEQCWSDAFDGNKTKKPPYWAKEIWRLDEEEPSNNGFENEDLMVWMRTAALPNFRKLWRRIEAIGDFETKLPAGNYTFQIDYNYPVDQFHGRKKLILSTVSWLGAKNPFLGIAYIVVGSLCILLGIVFLVIHVKFGKSLTDMANITRS